MAIEEDDGFWTGGDDPVGSGSVSVPVVVKDGYKLYDFYDANVGGNTMKLQIDMRCE